MKFYITLLPILIYGCLYQEFVFSQPANDNCSSATNLGTLSLGTQVCQSSTNVNATAASPYISQKNCGGSGGNMTNPARDVWFKFVPDSGERLFVQITGALTNPQIALWEGTNCNQFMGRGCATGSGGALADTFYALKPGNTYFLQVSGNSSTQEGSFDLCITNTTKSGTCLIRSSLTTIPPTNYGYFQHETTVQFCYTVQRYNLNNTNFFHGIVPIFGTGWDTANMTTIPASSCIGGGVWKWFNGITTPDGIMNGFFYDENSNGPNNNFGDGCINGNWQFCWTIKTPSSGACVDGADLSITILNYADGETGAWNDPNTCASDPPYKFNSSLICCLTPTIASTNVTCIGSNDGKAKATGQGKPPYTFKWSTGATTDSISGLSPGTYTVTVTDKDGCWEDNSLIITEPTALTLSTTSTPATCGNSDGTATVTPSGGTPSYTYKWSTGSTGSTATGLSIGIYTATVYDANKCVKNTSITISKSENVTSSTTNVSCNGGTNGTATIVVTGGNPPYKFSWVNGQKDSVATALSIGTYTVTVRDVNNCSLTVRTVTISEPSPLSISMSSTQSCFQDSTGTATVNTSGGTPLYTFKWSNGKQSSGITVLKTGTYTVTAKDSKGCFIIDSVVVPEGPKLNLFVSKIDITCTGENDGTAIASASGGSPGYTYTWSEGTVNDTAINLMPATYTVVLKDSLGCTKTDSVEVLDPPPFTTIISKTDATGCGASDGTATESASGGYPPYTYTWVVGQLGPTATGLKAGIYAVSIKDAKGCLETDTIIINDMGSPGVAITTITPASCEYSSDGTATASAFGGVPPYTYSWSPSGKTGSFATGLAGGGFQTLVVTGANGCEVNIFELIPEPDSLKTSLSIVPVSCFGGIDGKAIATSVEGGNGGYTYAWNTTPVQTTTTATGLIAGTYILSTSDVKGCTLRSNIAVTQPLLLTATLDSTNVNCKFGSDGTATVSASGGNTPYNYKWSNNGTSKTISGLVKGTYTVTVLDFKNCIYIDSVIVNEPSVIIATIIDSTNVSCFGGNDGSAKVTVTGGTPPYTYSWIPSGGTGEIATALSSGTYTMQAFDKNGCGPSDVVIISQPLPISVKKDSTNATCGNPDGSASVSASGGTAPYSYRWSTPTVQTDSAATSLTGGTYFVTITDSKGCIKIDSVKIENELLYFTSTTPVTCFAGSDGTATISIAGGNPPFTYSWTPSGQTTAVATGITAGTHVIVVEDVIGCKSKAILSVIQPSSYTITALSQTNVSCNGGSDGSAKVSASGGTPSFSYLWSNGTADSIANGLTAATYTATAIDAQGCKITAIVIITQPNVLTTATSKTDVSCNGGSNGTASANASGGTSPYTYKWSNGGTSNSISSLLPGSYYLTVRDSKNCLKIDSVTVNQPVVLTGVISDSTNISCNGGSDGIATASPSGGNLPYTYSWNTTPIKTTQSASGLISGVHVVTVTDSKSCQTTVTVTLNQPTIITPSITKTDASCKGFSDGTATVTASGGTPPYNFIWSNFQTTSTATLLIAGIYTATIIDAKLCTTTSSITIIEPDTLVSNITPIHVTCNGLSNASLTASPTGGTIAYTYLWSTGSTNSNITGLPIGTYTLIVTDNKGCIANDTVIIVQPSVLTVTVFQKTDVSCNGGNDGTAAASGSGGTIPYNYSWTSGSSDSNAVLLSAGTFTVTIIDNNSCRATSNIVINQPSALIATISDSVNISCNGGSDGIATVAASGGTTAYTYSWNTSPVKTTLSASGLTAGVNIVTVADSKNCKTTASVNLTQPIAIINSIGKIDVSCNGFSDGSASVTTSGGTSSYNYTWSTTPPQTSSSATLLKAGIYTVTIGDAQLCTAIVSITINEPLVLSVTIDSQNVSCKNFSDGTAMAVSVGGSTPYAYLWSNGNTSITATGLAAGNYNVIVTDKNACTNVASVIITEPTLLNSFIQRKTDVTCNGGNDGTAEASASGGTLPYQFKWSNSESDTLAESLTAGTQTVTVVDANLCIAISNIVLTQPTPVVVVATSSFDTICIGNDATTLFATATGSYGSYTYLWNNGLGTGNLVSASPDISTLYVITATDSMGCTGDTTVFVAVYDSLKVDALGAILICVGKSTSISANATGGNGNYSYVWDNGTEGVGVGQSVSVSPTTTTTYTVTLKDNCGTPSIKDTVTVKILDVNFTLSPSEGCPPLKVDFQDSSNSDSLSQWIWDFGDGSTSNEINPTHYYTETGTYTVTLGIKTSQGCISSKIRNNLIVVYPSPKADFSMSHTQATLLNTIKFKDKSTGTTVWKWNFGDGTTSAYSDPFHDYYDTAHYTVELIVFNNNGCSDTITDNIYIGPEFAFYIPNAFTPNSDALNDYFYGKGIGIAEFKFFIFDKWGSMVFKTSDINDAWDGSKFNSGKIASIGVFVYLVEIVDYFGEEHRYIGHFTLMR